MGHPPLSFGEFIRAHPQGCFVCYGRNNGFNGDHRTCPIHKADTEAYKKVHGSKKCEPAGIRETKVEVTMDELSNDVGGDRVGDQDPGDQEVLGPHVGRQDQGQAQEG